MSHTTPSSTRPDLLSLRLLVAAIEEGNLIRAAERENIAVSGVSRRISDLEQRWGVQLLHRHDRGVRPTAAASAILDRLTEVLATLDAIVEDVGAFASGMRGHLRVHANMTAVAGDLAAHIAQFTAAHPGVTVELEEATTLDSIQAVRIGRSDIAIISDTLEAPGLHKVPWLDDELLVVLPAGHALASRTQLRFDDLLDYPFIGMQHDSALQLLYRAKANELGREMDERAHVSSFSAAKTLVAAGCGLSILPRVAACRTDPAPFAVRTLDEPWASRKVAICVRSPRMPASESAFVNLLLGQARNHAEKEPVGLQASGHPRP